LSDSGVDGTPRLAGDDTGRVHHALPKVNARINDIWHVVCPGHRSDNGAIDDLFVPDV
jgi:hypothetical protein